eukprot:CAMPEP_0183742380 /NCGR_PEP_ID=MMETSP0737-20130205/64603_1 /TAXON_ID=385413 /ORGANISM="Thalassiosira miniscula, Strain CCMP1093" /LENGTH=801 /DNA_ID=CAMNT_0025977961 /DNA_START=90 /DNA_END=2495 /DNA_ORIENTATION=+
MTKTTGAKDLDLTFHRTNTIPSGHHKQQSVDSKSIPRIISYKRLHDDDDEKSEDPQDTGNCSSLSKPSMTKRRETSDMTTDIDAISSMREGESLLKMSSRAAPPPTNYGGTSTTISNGNNGNSGSGNGISLAEQYMPKSTLKQDPSFSPKRLSSTLSSDDVESGADRTPTSLAENRGWFSTRQHGDGSHNNNKDMRSSFSAKFSDNFALRGSFVQLLSHTNIDPNFLLQDHETTILAPEELHLPPGTALRGSSKFAANAIIHASMRARTAGSSFGGGEEEDSVGSSTIHTLNSIRTARTLRELEEEYQEYLAKTRTTFLNDAMTFAEGTIPQSMVIATVIGCVCGLVAYCYYYVLDFFLEFIWKTLPERFVMDVWPEKFRVLWIPLVSFSLSIACGLSVYYLGEPGDLAYTIKCVHEQGYKGTSHIVPMVAASLFSILAGASLGPEAPLVAICAATAGYISRKLFKQTNRNVVRKHTFMGMAGALAAFFGVPMGGSMFALEVTSRFGIEYFEHLIEAIFAGLICVTVFRSLAGLPLEQIWDITDISLEHTDPYMIVLGACIGLMGAGVSYLWAHFHWRLMDLFGGLGLLDDENKHAVPRVLLGACGVVSIGMLVPHTMFWGEWEIGTIATLSKASDLPHVWPTSGLIDFEMDTGVKCLIVGFCKLMAISFTVAGGFRGGYIFPFFSAGAAFGRALCFVFPTLSPVIATLCFAAGINVAITRTALATSLILAFLGGEQFAMPAILSASVISLFATGYLPFIKSQLARSDIDFSLYYKKNAQPKVQDSVRLADGPMSIDMNKN